MDNFTNNSFDASTDHDSWTFLEEFIAPDAEVSSLSGLVPGNLIRGHFVSQPWHPVRLKYRFLFTDETADISGEQDLPTLQGEISMGTSHLDSSHQWNNLRTFNPSYGSLSETQSLAKDPRDVFPWNENLKQYLVKKDETIGVFSKVGHEAYDGTLGLSAISSLFSSVVTEDCLGGDIELLYPHSLNVVVGFMNPNARAVDNDAFRKIAVTYFGQRLKQDYNARREKKCRVVGEIKCLLFMAKNTPLARLQFRCPDTVRVWRLCDGNNNVRLRESNWRGLYFKDVCSSSRELKNALSSPLKRAFKRAAKELHPASPQPPQATRGKDIGSMMGRDVDEEALSQQETCLPKQDTCPCIQGHAGMDQRKWWDRLPISQLPYAGMDAQEPQGLEDELQIGRVIALVDTDKARAASEVAIQLARRWESQEQGRYIIWLDASSDATLRASYLSAMRQVTFASSSDLIEGKTDLSTSAMADSLMALLFKKREMSDRDHRFVMIFANAPPEDQGFYNKFFSAQSSFWNARGTFIVTTCAQHALEVEVMDGNGTTRVPIQSIVCTADETA